MNEKLGARADCRDGAPAWDAGDDFEQHARTRRAPDKIMITEQDWTEEHAVAWEAATKSMSEVVPSHPMVGGVFESLF